MKTILLWSRSTDRRILVAVGMLAAAAAVGSMLPSPDLVENLWLLQGFIAATMLVLVWGVFHLVRLSRYGHRWVVAEAIGVPLLWVLLVVLFGLWLGHLKETEKIQHLENYVIL